MEEGMVCVTVTRKCPTAFLRRQHLAVFQRLCVQTSGAVGDLQGHPAHPAPLESSPSADWASEQSRQIGTCRAGQLASAGRSDLLRGHQVLDRRAGSQDLAAVSGPVLPPIPLLTSQVWEKVIFPGPGPSLAPLTPSGR